MIDLKRIELQAHKGVEPECPENTMAAFYAAIAQGYDVIELDLRYTADGRIVVLHDESINRTARYADGARIEKEVKIDELTYSDALEYDFGIGKSNKFAGEKIPLFEQAAALAVQNGIRLKIDNKIQEFPEEMFSAFAECIKNCSEYVSITADSIEFAERCIGIFPKVSIDYDGAVSEGALKRLGEIVPRERLTVWLPYRCKKTSWVRLPFADKKIAETVRKYARLGIWVLDSYEDFYKAAKQLQPDIVETDGTVKPLMNKGVRFDMHTHSENSHDSSCPVLHMAESAAGRRLGGFAVTDHCDIEYCDTVDLDSLIKKSLADAQDAEAKTGLRVLKGIEMGEAFWHPEVTERLLHDYDFDMVIGSVHAVRYGDYTEPYSKIDFAAMGAETAVKYLDRYFDDILQMLKFCDIDVLAHLTCPLRYINGRYMLNIDCRAFKDKIEEILSFIIEHGIALEVNTSCVYDRSGYCEFLPEEWIIKRYAEMGGYLITTASDAHIADNCANAFETLCERLKDMGFKNTFYFEKRCAVQCAL